MKLQTKDINLLFLLNLLVALLFTVALGLKLGFFHPLTWGVLIFFLITLYVARKTSSGDYIQWSDSMNTGIEAIDNDHKKLLSLINQLQAAIEHTIDSELIHKVLDELVSYTHYHFEREELLMRLNHYPEYVTHKKQHETMIEKISECVEKYQSDPSNTINDTHSFLKNWLIQHIMGSDREYIPYIKSTD